jgi:hypothetical protein
MQWLEAILLSAGNKAKIRTADRDVIVTERHWTPIQYHYSAYFIPLDGDIERVEGKGFTEFSEFCRYLDQFGVTIATMRWESI